MSNPTQQLLFFLVLYTVPFKKPSFMLLYAPSVHSLLLHIIIENILIGYLYMVYYAATYRLSGIHNNDNYYY